MRLVFNELAGHGHEKPIVSCASRCDSPNTFGRTFILPMKQSTWASYPPIKLSASASAVSRSRDWESGGKIYYSEIKQRGRASAALPGNVSISATSISSTCDYTTQQTVTLIGTGTALTANS